MIILSIKWHRKQNGAFFLTNITVGPPQHPAVAVDVALLLRPVRRRLVWMMHCLPRQVEEVRCGWIVGVQRGDCALAADVRRILLGLTVRKRSRSFLSAFPMFVPSLSW